MNCSRTIALAALSAAACVLCACAMPQTDTFQGGDHGSLIFPGAPAGAEVLLDGRVAGAATNFVKPGQGLSVSGGAHSVRVFVGGTVLVDRRVYVDNGALVRIEVKP